MKNVQVFNQDLSKWCTPADLTEAFVGTSCVDDCGVNKGALDDTSIRTAVAKWISNQAEATGTYGHISAWCTSKVTDMSNLFENQQSFNDDISDWNVGAVTDMMDMFADAVAFNQDVGKWNVSAVTDMSVMFNEAKAFNQDIGDWDVAAVTNMHGLFKGASVFNQDLSKWCTTCLLYTSPSPRDLSTSRMPSSA